MSFKKLLAARDVTSGRPWKRLVELAVPLMIGNFAQGLYNTVDTIVVGKYVGDDALSAVGAAGPLTNFLFVFFIGLGTGVSILVSQRYGAKDRQGLALVLGNCVVLSFIVSVLTMVLGLVLTRCPIFGGRDLLQLMNTPAGNIYLWCRSYLSILFLGVTATVFYNIFSGCLRALGDNVSALVFLIAGCIINIILDVVFVADLGMGVIGAAVATVLAQVLSACACAFKLFNMKDVFSVSRKDLRLRKNMVSRILSLGIPSGIGQGIFAFSNFLIQSVTNGIGPMAMACNVVVMRIDSFIMMPFLSLGTAMTTYTGQNYGAKKLERMETGVRQGLLLAFGTGFVLTSLLVFFNKYVSVLFTDTDELINMADTAIKILAAGYLIMGMSQSLTGYLRGIGATTTTMLIVMMTQIGIRMPLTYVLAHLTRSEANPHGDFRSLYYSMLASWLIGILIDTFFFRKKKKEIRMRADDSWQLNYEE